MNLRGSGECEESLPVMSFSVQAAFKHVVSASLNGTLGQVHLASTEEIQPDTAAASDRHRFYSDKQYIVSLLGGPHIDRGVHTRQGLALSIASAVSATAQDKKAVSGRKIVSFILR